MIHRKFMCLMQILTHRNEESNKSENTWFSYDWRINSKWSEIREVMKKYNAGGTNEVGGKERKEGTLAQ